MSDPSRGSDDATVEEIEEFDASEEAEVDDDADTDE